MTKSTLTTLLRMIGGIAALVLIVTFIAYGLPVLKKRAYEREMREAQARQEEEERRYQKAAAEQKRVTDSIKQIIDMQYARQMAIKDSIYEANNRFLKIENLSLGLTFTRDFSDLPKEWEYIDEPLPNIARFTVRDPGKDVHWVFLELVGDDWQWKVRGIQKTTEDANAAAVEELARHAASNAAVQERLQQGNAAYNKAVRHKARVDRKNQQYNEAGAVRSYGEIYNDIHK